MLSKARQYGAESIVPTGVFPDEKWIEVFHELYW